MLEFLHGSQDAIKPFVLPLVIAVGSLLFIIAFFYIILIIYHLKRRKRLTELREEWKQALREVDINSNSEIPFKKQEFPETYRDYFVLTMRELNLPLNQRVKSYRATGYYEKDLRELSHRYWWKRVQALNRLKYLGTRDLETKIRSLLYDESHEVRLVALDTLSYLKQVPDLDPISLFKSFSEKLESFLTIQLFTIKPDKTFIKPLINSENNRFRRVGTILLGQSNKRNYIPELIELAKDEEASVRRRAAESLGKIGVKNSISILKRTSRDSCSSVREATALALGKISFEESLEVLAELAEDDDLSVRISAFHSLANFGEEGRNIIGDHWSDNRELAREAIFESYQR
ncbi:MAG: HEAT repeat domain-containing protein [Candidatus Bipolaricaulia bacterium]